MRNLLIILILSTTNQLNRSMDIWKDKPQYGFLDYDEPNFEEKCADNEICQNSFDDLFKRKSKESDDSNGLSKKSARVGIYHSAPHMPCSCQMGFRNLDLGHQYYPRYLHTAVCKSDVCPGLYRCVEKLYKVGVLKQKDPQNPDTKTSMSFPENHKRIWQPELITVTVACECNL